VKSLFSSACFFKCNLCCYAWGKGLDVRLNWKATEVHHSGGGGSAGGGVRIKGAGLKGDDETVEARRCIIAAPITALKRGRGLYTLSSVYP
jgi:hypothetical protein